MFPTMCVFSILSLTVKRNIPLEKPEAALHKKITVTLVTLCMKL